MSSEPKKSIEDRVQDLESRIHGVEMHTGFGKGGDWVHRMFFARLLGQIIGSLATIAVIYFLLKVLEL